MYLYVDGSLLVHNQVHAIESSELRQGGAPMLALRVVNMISQFIRYYQATRVYFCLDPKEGSWRKHIDQNYKAQRKEKLEDPEEKFKKDLADLAIQQVLPELLQLLIVPVFLAPFIEADDWCAALIKLNKGHRGVIITSDRDYYQLLSPEVSLLNPQHQYRIEMGDNGYLLKIKADGSMEPLFVTPAQQLLQKALMGDPSDNLPGLCGVGEVTALKAIQHGTVRQLILENTGNVTPRKSKKNPNPQPFFQDAQAILKHNVRMMDLLNSEVINKVVTLAEGIQKSAIRQQQNNYTKLLMWLESNGYANEDLAKDLVATYTRMWIS